MSREEFEELLYYVVELKDKLNAKLDEQCAKINHQGTIINQQGQIVDELCWQLRELSEKVRELRVENRRLTERLGRFCPKCTGCRCDSDTYANHLADKYNELAMEVETEEKKRAIPSSLPSSTAADSDKTVDMIEGKDKPLLLQQQQQQQQQLKNVDEYSQVMKKRDTQTSKKKWLFGGTFDRKVAPADIADKPSVVSSNTIWYLDDESIYEPIELSAKPSTRAQLEKITAEVLSSSTGAPKPAPRRLYAAAAVDNLAQYFADGDRPPDEVIKKKDGDDDDERDDDVWLRPNRVKQFNSESRRGSSKVACSQLSDLEQSYLPTEQNINSENFVRFTINSRPATTATAATPVRSGGVSDNRRHAIRSYM
ncbi:uncharacterized protein LOC131683362 [Topomyia yanbarensis]|uniref:uncharacterized protein LOC131683362 n=1 Tax=Topomyia yanbarensis TaxID=2498891 RepID=UPI00273AF42F|nr:uncharacterized protein LOC131683362 [Topomyia yanbarensis]